MHRFARPLRRGLDLSLVLIAVLASAAHAQGVGINATGAAADTSAILDLSATNKGLLVPRMTAAQRAAIVLPANGLVVYQTDGTSGLYSNAGSSASPNWQMVGAGAASGQWSTSGANLYYTSGKVAVGTTPGAYRFTVLDTGSVLRVQANNANGVMASFGGAGQIQVDAPGIVGGRLSLLDNGNLGLGVANPTSKLSFAAALGKKISLYPGATGDVGFAVSGNRLQIYSDNPNADVALGYDAAGTFNERFAFKPNGAMAVNGNTGAAGQVLQSNGAGAAATWVNPTSVTYANVLSATSTTAIGRSAGDPPVTIPDMSLTFTVPGNASAIVTFSMPVIATVCFACTGGTAYLDLVVDGATANRWEAHMPNNQLNHIAGSWMAQLGPGTHTLRLDMLAPAGDHMAMGLLGSARASMIVQVIPQ